MKRSVAKEYTSISECSLVSRNRRHMTKRRNVVRQSSASFRFAEIVPAARTVFVRESWAGVFPSENSRLPSKSRVNSRACGCVIIHAGEYACFTPSVGRLKRKRAADCIFLRCDERVFWCWCCCGRCATAAVRHAIAIFTSVMVKVLPLYSVNWCCCCGCCCCPCCPCCFC